MVVLSRIQIIQHDHCSSTFREVVAMPMSPTEAQTLESMPKRWTCTRIIRTGLDMSLYRSTPSTCIGRKTVMMDKKTISCEYDSVAEMPLFIYTEFTLAQRSHGLYGHLSMCVHWRETFNSDRDYDNNRDFQFVDYLIDRLVDEGKVDRNYIFLTGHSNGAFFAQAYGIARGLRPNVRLGMRPLAIDLTSHFLALSTTALLLHPPHPGG